MRNLDSDYTTRSGILTVVSDKISIRLDDYGQYEYRIDGRLSADETKAIHDLNSLEHADEDQVGGKLYGYLRGIQHDSVIGYYSDLYCGYVAEGDYRKNGTSGGVATWLQVELLERGLVDGVICAGASEKSGILYEYKVLRTADEVRAHSKSRYYPMELSEVLRFVKKQKGRYVIVGIPSFISDIRRLQAVDNVFADRIKYTIGLLCGHQKTTKYGEAIAFEAGIKPDEIKSIDFRYKVADGIASDYVSEVVGAKDGKEVRVLRKPDETYVNNWGAGMFKANFSDYIDDCFSETADVTLGDAWLPQYVVDGRGTSVIIVRNKVISEIIKDAYDTGRLTLDIVDAQTVLSSQKGMINQYRQDLPYRLSKVKSRGIKKRIKPSKGIPFLRRIVQDLRLEMAKMSKIHYKKAVELDDWSYFERKMNPLLRKYQLVYRIIHIQKLGVRGVVSKLRSKLVRR